MPKIVTQLTDTKLKTAKVKDKDYTLSDGYGLQLLIKRNNSKLWEFYYQSPTTQKRRKTSFGLYPEVTLIQARNKRKEYKDLLFDGIDPIDYFKEKKQEISNKQKGLFENVLFEWLEKKQDDVDKGIIVLKTYQRLESFMVNDTLPFFKKINGHKIKPILPNANIKDIKHFHIVKVLEHKNKTAPVSAKKMFQYFNKFWLYAVNKGYCDFNIISNIDPKSIITQRRVINMPKITEPDIFKELVNTIYTYQGHYSTKNALKLVLHVPLRASNLIKLKWKYIDFDKELLTIPRKLMKIKNPNLPDFSMPLSEEVIEILKEQRTLSHSIEYVFTGSSGKPINQETPNHALIRMGFNDSKRQRLHGFRGTFRSILDTHQLEHNISLEIKEIALDHHSTNMVQLAYTNKADYVKQLKPLMDWWSEFILSVQKG